MRTPVSFNRVVVIGGGCYGSWYTQQLARAYERGALLCKEIVVVDHNESPSAKRSALSGSYGELPLSFVRAEWHEYVGSWLKLGEEALRNDAMVPSPLMPHLLLDWLISQASIRWPNREVRVAPLDRTPDVPWQRAAPDSRHYVSFAEWMCPVNCIEPVKCPITRGERHWSLPVTLRRFANEGSRDSMQLRGHVIFPCIHRTWGVGMIDVAPVASADLQIARWGEEGPINVLVGTTSHCHGALGVLSID